MPGEGIELRRSFKSPSPKTDPGGPSKSTVIANFGLQGASRDMMFSECDSHRTSQKAVLGEGVSQKTPRNAMSHARGS